MGLDLVELVLRVEETFDLAIRDEEAGELDTVGKLHDYVWGVLNQPDAVCPSSRGFYRLRSAMMHALQIPRQTVRPDSPLEELVPRRGRRRRWAQLGKTSGLALPDLHRPRWLRVSMLSAKGLGLAMTLGAAHTLTSVGLSTADAVALTGRGFVIASVTLGIVTRPLAVCFAPTSATVTDLVRFVVQRQPADLGGHGRDWTEDEVWETIRELTADEGGVPLEEITRESRFVRDLGMG